jgi:hypothetical protein
MVTEVDIVLPKVCEKFLGKRSSAEITGTNQNHSKENLMRVRWTGTR